MRLFSAFALSVALVVIGCYDDSELREQMNNQQAEMNAALQELRAADAELNGLVSAIAARVAELEATVDGIETSVGNLGTEVDNLETEVGGIKTDMEDIDTGLSGLENSINALQNRVSQLENHVPDSGNTGNGGSGETGADYAEQIAAMQKELADLKSAVQSSWDMYSKLQSNMEGLQEMLYQHDSNLNEVRVRLESYEAFMAEFNDFKAWVQQELDIIKADIEDIKSSLLELITADADLNALITALNSRVEQLEAEITALKNGESGGNGGTVTPPDDSQVENIEVRIAALEQEMQAINTALESLGTKDDELEDAINNLAAIVATNKTEAEAMFADLAEFNALKEAVETLEEEYAEEFGLIKSDINTIKQSLTSLEEADKGVAGLISALEERATEIETDIEILENSVTGSIETVNSRMAELSEELTAVKTAIQDLQAKDLQIDDAIASLNASMEADLAEQLAQIEGLSEILQQHIQTATTTYATQEALSGLSAEIVAMRLQYETEFSLIKSDIAEIVAMIQSMSFISHYNDGAATALCFPDGTQNVGTVEFNYIVRPAGTAERLVRAWQEAQTKDMLQIRAHYTVTRASFGLFDLPVAHVEADGDILTVIAEAEGVTDAFVNGLETLSASLLVTDGRTDYCTDFVNVVSSVIPDLSAHGSANSYIVSESGVYRFRTVKGNSNDSVGGVDIDDYSVNGIPATAEVYWETFGTDVMPTEGDLIKQVTYKDGYVMFRTADLFREGNALIVVKGESGGILWSWHIWMTDVPKEQVYYNNAGILMDRNLGATSATPGDVGAHGLFYQWGRKDPFLGISANVYETTTACKATGFWPGTYEVSIASTIKGTMEAPTLFITSSTESGISNDWLGKDPWSVSDVRWTGADQDKSIYDPCPPGWRVPEYEVWSDARRGSTLTGAVMGDTVKLGMNFKGYFGDDDIWYPCTGEMSYSTGEIRGGGGWCRMWSASANLYQPKSFLFYFSPVTGTISMPYMERASGYSVRCKKDE